MPATTDPVVQEPHAAAAVVEDKLQSVISQIEDDIGVALGSLDGIRRELDNGIAEHVALSDHIRSEGEGVAAVIGEVQQATVSLSAEMVRLDGARDVIVAESARVKSTVDDASHSAEQAREELQELVKAIGSIAGVIHLIDRVSKDTRLLALNASIEARRVGTQGRAFGVIADEVKTLAEDTAKATADITQRIVRLNASAASSMTAISRMVDIAKELTPSFAAVTTAIDEQGSVISVAATATGQLAGSAREAAARADGLREFTEVAVTEASSIKTASNRLADFMGQFTRRITTSARHSAALGRRREPRSTVKKAATLAYLGRSYHCTTVDLSPGGVLVMPRPDMDLPVGATVTVSMQDVGSVEARLTQASVKGLHLAFSSDQDVRAKVEEIVRAAAEANAEAVSLAMNGAEMLTGLLESAVDRGEIQIGELFPSQYDPIPNTEPRQFECKALPFYERIFPRTLEAILRADGEMFYAIANDRNGYCPVHNKEQSKPQKYGDPTFNARYSRNRSLRFDDDVLEIVRSEAPHLIRRYRRDLGDSFDMIKDVSAPIFVKGRHWGAFRTGWPL